MRRRRGTDRLAVHHQQVIDLDPVFPGQHSSQGEFGLGRILCSDDAQPVGHFVYMCIDTDARDSEPKGEDQIGCFSSHTGKTHKLIDRIRHFPTDEGEERVIENVPDRVLANLLIRYGLSGSVLRASSNSLMAFSYSPSR